MTPSPDRPMTHETKRLLNAIISDLPITAAQQALYAIAEALTKYHTLHKDSFQDIIDDARSYAKLVKR